MNTVMSALNLALNRGDLIAVAKNVNGFLEVTKGVVVNIEDDERVKILAVKGERYYGGKPYMFQGTLATSDAVKHTTMFGRMMVNVSPDLAMQDPDFVRLFNSNKYLKLGL